MQNWVHTWVNVSGCDGGLRGKVRLVHLEAGLAHTCSRSMAPGAESAPTGVPPTMPVSPLQLLLSSGTTATQHQSNDSPLTSEGAGLGPN